MRVRIWRGAHEIGGSCVEVASDSGDRIVIDAGKPLWAGWDDLVPLPAVPGLAEGGDANLRGLLISHPHQDHYGLLPQVHPSVPVYIGREAAAVLSAAEFFSPAGLDMRLTGDLTDLAPLHLGSFRILPYLADHSAFDAYSLLVEGDGRRLFYTGDLRGHGRKSSLFQRLLVNPPKDVDVLLMEGTHVRADAKAESEPSTTEAAVELSMAKAFRETDGLVVVVSSAQNIDRLVTVYRACKRAGRTLAVDLYTATVARATGRPAIPQPGFPRLEIFVPLRQRIRVKQAAEFWRTERIKSLRLYPEDLPGRRSELVVMTPTSAVTEILATGALRGGALIWSMWPGYLKDPSGARLVSVLQDAGVPLLQAHASGHASIADLQALVEAVNPKRVVPIHSEGGHRYDEYFTRVELHADLEWWKV